MEVCESTEGEATLILSVQEDIEDCSLADSLYWLMLMAIRRDWLLRMNRILNKL